MAPVIHCSAGNIRLFHGTSFIARNDIHLTKYDASRKYARLTCCRRLPSPQSSLGLFQISRSGSGSKYRSEIQTVAAVGTDVTVEELSPAVSGDKADETLESPPKPVETTEAPLAGSAVNTASRIKRARPGRKSDMPPVKDEELVAGASFTGKVRSIQPFGAFVDFGAFTDGLVHVSRISDGYVKDIGAVVSIGQEVKVRIIEANMESRRISLTMRDGDDTSKPQQRPDVSSSGSSDKPRPARSNAGRPNQKRGDVQKSKFVKGQVLDGTVKKLTRSGAFVSLPEGEEGFLPVSEESEGFDSILGNSSLTVGQEVNVRVLRLTRGVTLTMKKEEHTGKAKVPHHPPLAIDMAPKTEAHPSTGSLIYRPEKAGILDILSLLFLRRSLTSYKFVESSGNATLGVEDIIPDPLTALVIIIQKFLSAISTPLKWLGWILEFSINLLSLNHGIFGLILRLLTCSVVVPNREKANYRTIIGHIDGRTALYNRNTFINFVPSMDSQLNPFDGIDLLDLSAMAAKIAYENKAFIESVVTVDWKMHFVGYYNCWNKYLNDNTTQAFIFTNKEEDADLIVLAFRGTETFNATDWSTDIDLSRILMGKMGFMHLGFLKALGLQDDKDYTKGFPEQIDSIPDKLLAYYSLRDALSTLVKKHPNAKILVTGHSLGGALAIVFPALLAMHDQNDILNSMYGVVTYGQPRVGDALFGDYVDILMRLNYHRMVYRYDIVPRIPLDINPISLFKHCGTCIYYDGWYQGQLVDEVPNLNYFDPKYVPSMYLNAWGDLLKALFIGKTQGEEFKEGYVSILYRGFGLILPGVASHSPRDYVNAGRLAKITPKVME